jgi:type IV pilus assembly protein PilQ
VNEVSRGKTTLLAAVAIAVVGVPLVVGVTASAEAAKTSAAPVGKIELIAGKRVRLNYQNVEVRGLIKALAEAAKVNVLVSDKVTGTVTVDLAEMPWEQALEIVLGSQGLVKREAGGVIYIEPASAKA